MRKLLLAAVLLCAALVSTPAIAQVVAPVPIYLSDRNASGAITTNGLCASTGAVTVASGCVVLSSPGTSTVQVTATGTFTGPLAFQCLGADGLTWSSAAGSVQSTSTVGSWSLSYAGCTAMRVVPTGAMTGSAAVFMESSATSPAPALDPMGRAIVGNSTRATYSTSQAITIPTAAASLLAIESDAANKVRLRYLKVCLGPAALQTAAGVRQLFLFRSTAASSGGSTSVPLAMESSDVAFAGILRSGAITTTPAAPTQAVNAIWTGTISIGAAGPSAIVCTETKQFDLAGIKAPTALAGVANGLGLFDVTGGAGGAGTYVVDAEWTTESN